MSKIRAFDELSEGDAAASLSETSVNEDQTASIELESDIRKFLNSE